MVLLRPGIPVLIDMLPELMLYLLPPAPKSNLTYVGLFELSVELSAVSSWEVESSEYIPQRLEERIRT